MRVTQGSESYIRVSMVVKKANLESDVCVLYLGMAMAFPTGAF